MEEIGGGGAEERLRRDVPNLGDLLTSRNPEGLNDQECWAILCQAVQALQDLFLSDGATCVPLVTPHNVKLSSRGRVKFGHHTTTGGHIPGFLAPEYRLNKNYTDTEKEKMWIFGLGETLRRATLRPPPADDLALVLTEMTKTNPAARASLMHLLEVISEYCKRKQQTRPFSHIVMDLHQEAMAAVESVWDTPWSPPAMPELHLPRPPLAICDPSVVAATSTIPRRCWPAPLSKLRLAERCLSMEEIPRGDRLQHRRFPVQRSVSTLYPSEVRPNYCTGPEFVIRATLPHKQLILNEPNSKNTTTIVVILLNGRKVDVLCNPHATTAALLFEQIVQSEEIEENFMLGLSALIGGDFVFLPSDMKISKALNSTKLFLRIRFFLPNLRGVKTNETRHLLYLQLRRSILEHQLSCSFMQLVELNGFALQAEFGDYDHSRHGSNYFLTEHYIPETMSCALENNDSYLNQIIESHISKSGLTTDKAEENFIMLCQNLTHYGGHFYTAVWILKDDQKDVWLFLSPKGINLYERAQNASTYGPKLYEMFEWKSIQTLCYSKHYLCIIPQRITKLKKYKLKMDYKKSYFAFRLASLHHQFFLRLRTMSFSLQTLSKQFGIALKDIKNETNSLCKLRDGATDTVDVQSTVAKRRGVKMGTKAFGLSMSRSMEHLTGEEFFEEISLHSTPDFLPNFQETLNATLLEKLENFSFAEERILKTVTIARDHNNSLGVQITEGSDGNVYVQAVIMGGPAHLSGNILSGDQIIAVDGKLLIGLCYQKALDILTSTGNAVEFMLSRIAPPSDCTSNDSSRTPVEKYLTESCSEVPYHKHIRYEIEQELDNIKNREISKSCANFNMFPLNDPGLQTIALPRSLGLGRKWRGPVKYPVTPIKKICDNFDSDEEQVFI